MNWQWLCYVALGGALGSVARGAVLLLWPAPFPWATMLVNALGSLVVGWLMAKSASWGSPAWHPLLVTGFCGGFTTFSTFSWQTLELFNKGQAAAACANIALSVAVCMACVFCGFRLGA